MRVRVSLGVQKNEKRNNMKSYSYRTLYKRAVNGKVNEWTIEVNGHCYRTVSGYTDGLKTTTEWTCCDGKNVGKKNGTTAAAQAEKEALAEWRKRTERGYFVNIKDIDKSVIFKPMLANKWDDRKDKISYPIYSQPKLDGIRCIVRSDGMWTRTGKQIISAPHIFESLKPFFEENPDLIFDGELYADKYANDFNAIVSLVKKTKPTQRDLDDSAKVIDYHVYDLPSYDGVFWERYKELCKMELYTKTKCCVLVETNLVQKFSDVEIFYDNYVRVGYEGQMLRLNEKYENKRSNSLLKNKSFIDEEYAIVGVEEGGGNLTGMVGALVFQSKQGDKFNASVNGGWDYLKELWKERKSLIGKKATIAYFNLTPDGKPRFPKVKTIRDYE
jgi:DNA ligase-1